MHLSIDTLLRAAINKNASDLHLAAGHPPVMRVRGRMEPMQAESLEPRDCIALMKSVTPEQNQQELHERGATDFGFAFSDRARFRIAAFRQRGNVAIVLRRIPRELLRSGPWADGPPA